MLDYFHGANAGYVVELYERYLQDPLAVDERTRAYFEQAPPPLEMPPNGRVAPTPTASQDVRQAIAVTNLAQAIRE